MKKIIWPVLFCFLLGFFFFAFPPVGALKLKVIDSNQQAQRSVPIFFPASGLTFYTNEKGELFIPLLRSGIHPISISGDKAGITAKSVNVPVGNQSEYIVVVDAPDLTVASSRQ